MGITCTDQVIQHRRVATVGDEQDLQAFGPDVFDDLV